MTSDLAFLDEQVLNDWVVAQRWFASKTREVSQHRDRRRGPRSRSRSWCCA